MTAAARSGAGAVAGATGGTATGTATRTALGKGAGAGAGAGSGGGVVAGAGGVAEFIYRVPGVAGGARPGAHRGRGIGPGLDIAAHRRLFDHPDPRRLDLRASLADPRGEWLVRTTRQRASVTVQAIVDVSPSMQAGEGGGALNFARDFLHALGYSVFRSGDTVGLAAFDLTAREDLTRPPRGGRGVGASMVEAIETRRAPGRFTRGSVARVGQSGNGSPGEPGGRAIPANRHVAPGHDSPGVEALADCVLGLGGPRALVFVVSDFHFALDGVARAFEALGETMIVPLVPWNPLEIEPPEGRGWFAMRDAEDGRRRHVWLRERTRRRWREAAVARRSAIDEAFDTLGVVPLHVTGRFDAEALSRHFLERAA